MWEWDLETEKDIGAICQGNCKESKEIFFEQLLLDETLVEEEIWVLKEAVKSVGGVNYRLKAKRNYELLVRVAQRYRIIQIPQGEWGDYQRKIEKNKKEWINFQAEKVVGEALADGIKTDCYLIGRYKTELISMGYFDDAVMGVVATGREDMMQYLEQMISGTKAFYDIYDCTQPILIYTGVDVCYKILDTFSLRLGEALERLGQRIEYFDLSKQETEELLAYIRRRFKAVIGMQTYMFSGRFTDGSFVHDSMDIPLYNFVFDHPIRIKNNLEKIPQRLCILTLDGNYVKFVKEYYAHYARFLPPGGELEDFFDIKERKYEVSFVGSYGEGLWELFQDINYADRKTLYFLNRYVLNMRKDLRKTPEDAFRETLLYYGVIYTREEFIQKFHKVRWMFFWLSNYYRNKVILSLLNGGIKVHVYGKSWKHCSFATHSMLVIHDEVIGREALEVYASSKVTLNIMKWHKDGFTERIANAMLQKSVVVTDRTRYLEENFRDGEDILIFDLDCLQELPGQIKKILDNEEERSRIAENGYQKALKYHTWDQRAKKILEFIEEDR